MVFMVVQKSEVWNKDVIRDKIVGDSLISVDHTCEIQM